MARIPDKIDKYRIEELVAEGGMGAVYKGIHPTLDRPVILKKLTLRGNATITERFRREAKILLDFRNDNIVDVQDHFIQGRSHYIVMEYIDGMSVKELIEQQRYLDNCTAAYITLYTAKALKYAHSRGVVHRDIKPANVLISRDGEIKLADFGIASAGNPDTGEDSLTADGTTLGTPAYMAPEQFENSRTVDYRADLYSLGIMMYEMLTGLKPFPGGFTPETMRMIRKGKYKKPGKINPSIASELQRIIRSLIKPKPGSRYKNIDRLIIKLGKWLAAYKTEDLKEHLRLLIKEETAPPLKKKNKKMFKPVIAAVIIIAVLSASFAGLSSMTDLHKRILSPSGFGQVRFSSDIPDSDSTVIPHTEIFLDDGKDIPAAGLKVRYLPFKERYYSLPLYLPEGKYRAKTLIGEKIIWNSFRIVPWEKAGRGSEILLSLPPTMPAPVKLTFQVLDAESGWDLSGKTVLEVYRNGEFIPVKDTVVLSGEVCNFRMTADGYEKQEWVLNIKAGQISVHFQTELVPLNN